MTVGGAFYFQLISNLHSYCFSFETDDADAVLRLPPHDIIKAAFVENHHHTAPINAIAWRLLQCFSQRRISCSPMLEKIKCIAGILKPRKIQFTTIFKTYSLVGLFFTITKSSI